MNKKSWQKSILTFGIVCLFFSCGGGGNKNNQNGLDDRVLLTAKEALVLAEPLAKNTLPNGILSFIMCILYSPDNFNGVCNEWFFTFTDQTANLCTTVLVYPDYQKASDPITEKCPYSEGCPAGAIPEEWIDSDEAAKISLENGADKENLCCGQISLWGTTIYPEDDPMTSENESKYFSWLIQYTNDDVSISHIYYVSTDGKFLGKDLD
jgi:hypothetical protein